MLRITENILIDAWLTLAIVPIAFAGALGGIEKIMAAFSRRRIKQ